MAMNPYVQYMYSYPHKTAYRPLTGISLVDYVKYLEGPGHSLYLHLPFCQSKCGYCNLFSVTGQDKEAVNRYLDTLKRQMGQYHDLLVSCKTEFSDITIGGGTPLLLSESQLERVFTLLETYFICQPDRCIVIETAPNQTTPGKLELLKRFGVTRVSMGIQSFHDSELSALGRQHSADSAESALELLKTYTFVCVNLDFIYGIPGQTVSSLLTSLKKALAYEPEELFLYPLYVKHGAKLTKRLMGGMVLQPEEALSQYREAAAFLQSEGFRQDSMRRFVKRPPGQSGTARRSFSDCGSGTSLALGCGGRSYLGNLHFCTPYAVTREDCLAQLEAFAATRDYTVISHGFLLSRQEQKRRHVIRHLLIYPGLDMEHYRQQYQSSPLEDFSVLTEWLQAGWLEWTDGGQYLSLTAEGLALSDYLGPQLISREVHRRMAEWEAGHGL